MRTDIASYMLLVTTAARLFVDRTLPRWHPVTRRLLLLVLVMAFCLPIVTVANVVLLGAVILGIVVIDFLLLMLSAGSEGGRTWAIAAYAAAVTIAFTSTPLSEGFNARAVSMADFVSTNNALGALLRGRLLHDACLYAAGMLLAAFELHHPIIWAIDRLGIAPPSAEEEATRGRVIGYLERPIVFLLIITGNFVSLGLVFAAKTLTRFRRLSERHFAEYYLIGTLLSFGATALLAGILWLLSAP